MVQDLKTQLRTVGATSFGLRKFASKYLAHLLHQGEIIRGVVYGRYVSGEGLLKWTEGMLVATDRRILFIDRKPGYETFQELTYDVVSGVQKIFAWPFSAVTLFTRIGNFSLRYANPKCIDIFIHYIEKRRLESFSPINQHDNRAAIRVGRR